MLVILAYAMLTSLSRSLECVVISINDGGCWGSGAAVCGVIGGGDQIQCDGLTGGSIDG